MNGQDQFEHITDDWYFFSSMNKEARFVSHILRGVTYFVCLEFRNGASYDVQVKKDEVDKFLSKFLIIDSYTKEKSEDEKVKESLRGNYSVSEEKKTNQKLKIIPVKKDLEDDEPDTPVCLNDKGKKIIPMNEKEKETGIVKFELIQSLPQELYDTIQRLKEGKIKVAEAKEIANLSQTIINCAKVQLDFMKSFPKKS